ncbi:MAG TPA: sigma 54-interacting transcriptional regulator [Planctomycetota bacterium]|jgi:transcriptional regulator with GAF, ATPase, and Fis domain|nr:sigma 54-interacting transcriptional regulator [Planctomycetota bacterium]
MPYLVVRESGSERTVPITGPEVLIGRSRQNHVKLMTEQASRQHCRLMRSPQGGYRLIDGNSSNGTFVNGERVSEKDLADGDVITVGQATIVFRAGEPSKPVPRLPDPGALRLPLEDRNVRLLLQTVVNAASCQDLDAFLRDVVDDAVEIAQAERGVLFVPDAGGRLKPLVARDQARRPLGELVGISRSIPQQVYERRRSIFVLDTETAEEVRSESVELYHLRTVMCAPLKVGERLLGVLYVDSHAKAREYSATDLAIFEAVTNYLALTMENVRAAQEAQQRVEERRLALERENAVLRAALERRKHLIGECPAMKALYETVRKVAPTDATVLVLGESGTGKEAIAHVLHDLSPRSAAPFVVIDCAAIPETLLESELFGYEKGAFTGATSQKPGKLEMAQGGTVFLDEIGELSLNLQVKLLRALEQRVIHRVGGLEPVPIDVRLVAATNRNLEEMVRQGKFRQDLYFRLNVVSVVLPPLRERGDDVILLAEHFLREAAAAAGRSIKSFSEEARAALKAHRWEGNVRELKHRVEQAVILTNNLYISIEDLNLAGAAGAFRSLEEARDHWEKSYITQALALHEFNVTHTARALGISRQHLQNLIKKHGISRVSDTLEAEPVIPEPPPAK